MSRCAIGVDLGGTNLRIAAIDEAGKMLEKVSLPTRTRQGPDVVIREMCQAVGELARKLDGKSSLAGIGVGVPGILYLDKGILRRSPNLPGWENYPVREEIESHLGLRVFLENDANAAALGEKWLGVGRNFESLCLLTLGTGVGGGLILEGEIWHGFLGMAGELGHIVVAEDGLPCPCGGRGCLETEASATAIVRKAQEVLTAGRSPALAEARQESREITAELVYEIAKNGDTACREIFGSVGRYLGIGIAGLINSLNLPLYVIGGGVAEAWDLFAPALLEHALQRSYIFCEGNTRIERSVLKSDAGLYGAAYLGLAGTAAAPS
ncbi:MAG: ROK family protein [Acidobacteria bacterium]|nr:ROK family protein [Acidobacteriota bacterium]